MLALIASHDAVVAEKLRAVLQREGHECPASHLAPIERIVPRVLQAVPAPELVILVFEQQIDNHLEALSQLAARTQATLVVIAPANDPHQILRAIHAGADDYVDLHQDFASQLSAMLARLKSKGGATPVSGRLLTFTAAGGGTGASTLAINVAAALASKHQRCALLEFNPHFGALATMLSLSARHTLYDVTDKRDRLDLDVIEQAMVRHASGIHLLAGALAPLGSTEFQPDACCDVAEASRHGFPFVVVDAGRAFYCDGIEQLWRRSDVLVLAVRLELLALREARQALERFRHLGVEPDRVRVVANRYGQRGHLPTRKAEKALGTKISYFIADDPRNVNFSVNCGAPVITESPRSRVARDLRGMADNLLTMDGIIPSNATLEPGPAGDARVAMGGTGPMTKVLWPATPS